MVVSPTPIAGGIGPTPAVSGPTPLTVDFRAVTRFQTATQVYSRHPQRGQDGQSRGQKCLCITISSGRNLDDPVSQERSPRGVG